MRRISINVAMIGIFAGIGVAVFATAPVVPFSAQWPLYEALRTTSAIIFAVVGAWIAIAFPERLRLLTKREAGGEKSANARMLDLFAPVVNSTITLCVVLLVGVVAPVLRVVISNPETVGQLQRASYAALVFLTLWQVWTVVLTLVPADMLKTAMDRDLSFKRANDALKGQTKAVAPPEDAAGK